MLARLASEHSEVETVFQHASEVLGYDLWALSQNGPEEQLNSTIYTQPAMLAAGIATHQVLKKYDAHSPLVYAGHSLGEYTALVCAQSIDFKDAIKLVKERARLMQFAVPEGEGAMAAIVGLDAETVVGLCLQAESEGSVGPANFNSPGQIVVAGLTLPVDRVIQMAKQAGAKIAKRLAVGVPSHSPLMRSAADEFAVILNQVPIATPKIPVIHNSDVASHQHPDDIRRVLVEQLYSPVRWVETIEAIIAKGIGTVIECGPNKVLTGLNKRIDAKLQAFSVCEPEDFIQIEEKLSKGEPNVPMS